MTTTPVHTALADPTLVTPWLEPFPVAPAAEPHDPWAREPTFENIALGLHQCSEASIPLNAGTLAGMGACSQRFERIQRYVTRHNETFHITHDVVDSGDLDEEDIYWFMSQLEDGFANWGNSSEARDVMAMIANATGAPFDPDATFVKTRGTPYRKSISQYFDLLGEAGADSAWAPRFSSLDAHSNFEDAEDRAGERQTLFMHALIEFVHHEFWELNEGYSCECYDTSVTVTVTMGVICPCGYEDNVELSTRDISRGYIGWQCSDCDCEHEIHYGS